MKNTTLMKLEARTLKFEMCIVLDTDLSKMTIAEHRRLTLNTMRRLLSILGDGNNIIIPDDEVGAERITMSHARYSVSNTLDVLTGEVE